MTKKEWVEEAEKYQRKMDETEDVELKTAYEVKRDACYANSVYGDEEIQEFTN